FKTRLNPQFQGFSRKTARRFGFQQFKERKVILVSLFESTSNKFGLTFDCWRGVDGDDYIVVTCHWIDDKWVMQKRILAFRLFDPPHNAPRIAHLITSVCVEYGISNRIFSITTDNASNNIAAIPALKSSLNAVVGGVFFHTRCICHILNLCVQDALRIEELDDALGYMRKLVNLVKKSSAKRLIFKQMCQSRGIPFKSLKIDCSTRWNSTLNMLRSLLPYKQIIPSFLTSQIDHNLFIDSTIFTKFETLCELLSVFEKYTLTFSGSYYPTNHLVLPALVSISKVFKKYADVNFLKEIVYAMSDKFVKYFVSIPPLFLISAILDPRIKISGLHTGLKVFCEYVNSLHLLEVDLNPDIMYDSALTSLNSLYDLFEKETGNSKSTNVDGSVVDGSATDDFYTMVSASETTISKSSEIALYTSMHQVQHKGDDFDILAWWNGQASVYPTLAAIVLASFAPPASTVASESAFSLGGRILTPKRSRLLDTTLEMCVCLKDWVAAEQ
ncbi:hypothetical protein M569_03810, partial [Genlisea aurea]